MLTLTVALSISWLNSEWRYADFVPSKHNEYVSLLQEDETSPDEEFKGQRPDVVPSILQYVIFPPHTTTAARDR